MARTNNWLQKVEKELETAKKKGNVSEDIIELVSELRIHQSELEMQNEQLKESQEELSTLYNQYQELYNEAPIGYFTLNKEGIILNANIQGTKLLGLNKTLIIGRGFSQFIHKDDEDKYFITLSKAIETGSIQKLEVQLKRNNTLFYSHIEIMPLEKDEESYRIVITDVSERKKLEENLSENEERFRVAILNSPVNISAQDLNLVYTWQYNPQLGYSVHEVVGMNDYDILPLKTAEHVIELKQRAIKTNARVRDEVSVDFEGKIFYYDFVVEPTYDSQNKINGINNIVIDITDRKKAEEELKTSEKRYKSLAENIDSVLMRYDKDLRVIYLSPNSEEITGISTEEFIGKTNREVGMPEYLCDLWENAISKVFQTGEKNTLEFDMPTGEGEKTYYLILSPEFNSEASFDYVLGISTDITERKKFEEAIKKAHDYLEEKIEERTVELEEMNVALQENELKLKEVIEELKRSNRELQSFAYITSHDLQEPLRTIASFTQLLERRYKGQLDDNANEFMDYIVDAAKRMKDMIQGLLEYSRVDRMESEFVETDINEIVKNAILNLQSAIDESSADITYDDLPVVHCGPNQMITIFQNLIGNAIKFKKPQFPPRVHISSLLNYKNKEWVFSVEDNGIGMDSEYSNKIFEVFKQLHTREEYEGTGIGLSIVKRIIESNSGKIWFKSELGAGSTFYFTIPS